MQRKTSCVKNNFRGERNRKYQLLPIRLCTLTYLKFLLVSFVYFADETNWLSCTISAIYAKCKECFDLLIPKFYNLMFVAIATFIDHKYVPSYRKLYKTCHISMFIRKSTNKNM